MLQLIINCNKLLIYSKNVLVVISLQFIENKCYACKASVMLAKQALAGFQFKSKQPIVGSKGTIAGANRMQAII